MVKFKIGDKVRCKPGFSNNSTDGNKYGGYGYTEGVELTVLEIHHGRRPVYWFKENNGGGVYENALELVSKDLEIIIW